MENFKCDTNIHERLKTTTTTDQLVTHQYKVMQRIVRQRDQLLEHLNSNNIITKQQHCGVPWSDLEPNLLVCVNDMIMLEAIDCVKIFMRRHTSIHRIVPDSPT